MKTPKGLPCMGGKTTLLGPLLAIINDASKRYHLTTFLDLCGSGAKLTCGVDRSLFDHICYNDVNLGLANAIKCLADPAMTDEVVKTIHGFIQEGNPEETFNAIKKAYDKPNCNVIESGAGALFLIYSSFRNNRQSFAQERFDKCFIKKDQCQKFYRYNEVLKNVEAVSCDCFDIIKEYYDREDVFAFIDPPYLSGDTYGEDDWSWEKHEALRELIENTKMKVLICERVPYVYDKLKAPWHMNDMGDLPNGTPEGVTEYAWTNFEIPRDIKAIAQMASCERMRHPNSEMFGEGVPELEDEDE